MAVNCLETEATWKTDAGVIGTSYSRLASPNPFAKRMSPPRITDTAQPGAPRADHGSKIRSMRSPGSARCPAGGKMARASSRQAAAGTLAARRDRRQGTAIACSLVDPLAAAIADTRYGLMAAGAFVIAADRRWPVGLAVPAAR